MRTVDVAILGGGLAGNLLARQLRRTLPDLSVALFERDVERGYKVGESTVEIAAHYLVRRMGLATYLYQEHLPKNGLRFFFDSAERDLRLEDMSEIGINALPPYPSFQLDRARLERDLLVMNREAGVDVHLPAKVKNLVLGESGARHTFAAESDGERTEWSARWVVDATGRESMVARMLDLRLPEKSHRIAASWGRFTGITDMDGDTDSAWRARANDTCRSLSTNHFSYPGYWIWFIPLREGITSVGVVQEAKMWSPARHTAAGLLSYVREHRAPRWLTEKAEAIDVGAFTQLSYRTKRFFSSDRWALIGDAAAFADPFYSPGSDFIGTENDLVTDMIKRETRGESITEIVPLFDEFMQARLETTLAVYDQLYPTFGSYELFRAKSFFDTGTYYNLLFDAFHRDQHLEPRWLRATIRRRQGAMDMMTGVAKSFGMAAAEMMKRGTYYRKNAGHYELDGRKSFGAFVNVGAPRTRREVRERTEVVMKHCEELLSVALDGDFGPVPHLASERLSMEDTIADDPMDLPTDDSPT